MLITLLTILLISNALTIKEDKSILFSRSVQFALAANALIAFNNLYILPLAKGIGIYGGLFHVNTFSQTFNIFVLIISSIILTITSFYPRRVYTEHFSNIFKYMNHRFFYNKTKITNKMGEQFRILEYSLIIVFILTGSVFLMSSSDLISIFLSIELQSYGLYILSTLYRDSEKATSGGLTYFLLGGLSSCFILLGSSLLYSNTGTTSLEGIYVINSISGVQPENIDLDNTILYTYTPNYLNISLIILSVGFLFKISAAPFHF
jgi:NADH-ubiquinone oxidoreductase chain 2